MPSKRNVAAFVLHNHFSSLNIFIDPIVSARKRRRREIDMKRERKKERDVSASTPSSVWWWRWRQNVSFSLSLSLSLSSCLSLFSAFFLALTIGSINIFWKCVWAPKSCFQPWRISVLFAEFSFCRKLPTAHPLFVSACLIFFFSVFKSSPQCESETDVHKQRLFPASIDLWVLFWRCT